MVIFIFLEEKSFLSKKVYLTSIINKRKNNGLILGGIEMITNVEKIGFVHTFADEDPFTDNPHKGVVVNCELSNEKMNDYDLRDFYELQEFNVCVLFYHNGKVAVYVYDVDLLDYREEIVFSEEVVEKLRNFAKDYINQ